MDRVNENGLVHLASRYSVTAVLAKLEGVLNEKGIPVLARIDHSGDAAKAGLTMRPTELLIFGSAKAGTPLMIAAQTVAIDLPLKALAWEDEAGQVWLSYNTPHYVGERHHVPEDLIANIAGIAALCELAVG